MPERELRQRVRAALQRAFPGALVIGWPANAWTGGGWPDLLFWQFPVLIGLEVKQGRRSKPTPLQLARHALLRTHSIPVCTTRTPEGAVAFVSYWRRYNTMAFDPSLLAELEAALGNGPAPAPTDAEVEAGLAALDPEPEPESIQAQADKDYEAQLLSEQAEPETPFGAAAVLSEDPDAIAQNGEYVQPPLPGFEATLDPDAPAPDIEDLTAAVLSDQTAYLAALVLLRKSVDSLTLAVVNLIRELHVGSEDEVAQ